ncbi:MAG: tRNA (N6-isopentenyl adenosine(37)-C2)-methylthiotransferase MiaB [Acidobacteria bacterium]|mgnify:CR=1 FL=1|nr:MAG: tRNA (N6-isopentenyl adenosine(37)-C2)-methylthiotransferase MiaB [Acidobacteriota bacterium]REK10375.1 MAG: tRNA (N6-isopentenyl adenosine(37)-C2)-methylthiotransferase MiaB [Acidobacteriota bacterium]
MTTRDPETDMSSRSSKPECPTEASDGAVGEAGQTSPPERSRSESQERFFIETWGCQMNELDSQRLAGQLVQQGLLPTDRADEADVILLNSCSVREKAAHKAYSRLGEYRLLKRRQDRQVRIGFCGCVAQQEGEQALRRVPELDFVIGTGRVGEFRKVFDHVRRTGERTVATGFPQDREFDLDAISRDGQYKGMVTIVEGCDKRCTFCIVPTTRGPERSRPAREIVREVERLVAEGFVEIELLGQTVNHWREPEQPERDFADLLHQVAGLDGVQRLRFVTSYPRDFSDEMVECFARHPNISSYLHLPVQSGDDQVLRRMGRGYEIAAYDELVAKLRAARPRLALSTDLIVGFPGETDEQFERTLDLVRRTRFSSVYAFKYSPRPGTPALRLRDEPVPSEVADARLQALFAEQSTIQRQLNEELVGSRHAVLVTGPSRQEGYLSGRTDCHRIVHFRGDLERTPAGGLVDVEVTRAHPHSLLGRAA